MPSGPSRCERGQSVQAETHPRCRHRSRKLEPLGRQVVDLFGYVEVPSTKTVGLNCPPWPSQTDVKCRHTVSGGASGYRFARFLNSSRL